LLTGLVCCKSLKHESEIWSFLQNSCKRLIVLEVKENDNDINESVREYLARIGSKGGSAEVAKGFSTLTPEQRSANAKKAAETRWKKKGKAAKGKRKD
jgi:hypothetical protein